MSDDEYKDYEVLAMDVPGEQPEILESIHTAAPAFQGNAPPEIKRLLLEARTYSSRQHLLLEAIYGDRHMQDITTPAIDSNKLSEINNKCEGYVKLIKSSKLSKGRAT